jgi:hypothetical protein
MWLPPTWLIGAALSGGHHARSTHSARGILAVARGQTTKVVRCEACKQSYTYELKRTGYGVADEASVGAYSLAEQRAEADLQQLLATGIEVIPCPACGWYQSNMIPEAQRRHRRWMLYAGQCLTIGLIPVAVIPTSINVTYADNGTGPPIPWPIFAAGAAGLVGLLAVGIGMLWKYNLRQSYDPNREDVEARKRYGQSRATLLSEQEADG